MLIVLSTFVKAVIDWERMNECVCVSVCVCGGWAMGYVCVYVCVCMCVMRGWDGKAAWTHLHFGYFSFVAYFSELQNMIKGETSKRH